MSLVGCGDETITVFYAKFYKHQTCRKKSLLIKMPKQNESYSTIKNVCFKAIKAQKKPRIITGRHKHS